MSRSKYNEVVQAGMQVLDEKVPGWESRIDPETLDLASCQFCILGQIYGDYGVGRRALDLYSDYAHGFDVDGGVDRYYPLLTRAWLRVIGKRLTSKLNKISKRFST